MDSMAIYQNRCMMDSMAIFQNRCIMDSMAILQNRAINNYQDSTPSLISKLKQLTKHL